ncbi:MAG: F0F1 ATP synthase subunit B [Chloroflexota bacterium]
MKFGRPELVWSIINFAVFAVIMTRLLYRPLVTMLDARAEAVARQREQAERARLAAEELQAQSEAALDEARRQGERIVADAAQRAREVGDQIMADARRAADAFLAEARAASRREREMMVADLRRAVGELVIAAAQQALARNLDEALRHELVREATHSLQSLQ